MSPDESTSGAPIDQSLARTELHQPDQPATAPENAEPTDSAAETNDNGRQPEKQPEPIDKRLKGWMREGLELLVTTAVLLIAIRWGLGEPRYIPSSSMEPTFLVNDRIIVEKVTGHFGSAIQRGDILVFYPPSVELSNNPLSILGRMTGLPFLPNETAYIKRVIGLPGERIRVKKGEGVYVDGQLLVEPYVKEAANYDLAVMGDIGGRSDASFVKPYGDSNDPIIVPAGHLFMMGDNRNASADSHVWGFLDQKRTIGKAWLLFWRFLEPPPFSPPDQPG